MIKNGKKQNVVPTTRKQNLGAAMTCETYNEAVLLFRRLQYANNMGTGENDFFELEQHFINKQGVSDYVYNGLRSSDRQVDMNGDVYVREDEDYLDRD
tara:strand:- start:2134 stop:2427 length:294 start_codon:yes stop_codon:yes gene_type:complete